MKTSLQTFWHDDTAATAIEYCLLAGFIALAITSGLTAIGPRLNQYFVQVAAAAN